MRLQTQDNYYNNRMSYEQFLNCVEEHIHQQVKEINTIPYLITVTFALKKNFYLDGKGSILAYPVITHTHYM